MGVRRRLATRIIAGCVAGAGLGSASVGFSPSACRSMPPARGAAMQAAAPVARVGICQFPVTGDKDGNIAAAQGAIREAARRGAQLIVLPEIWNSPYATAAFPEYAEVCPDLGDDATKSPSPSVVAIARMAAELGLFIIGGSIPERDEAGRIYNTCIVYDPRGTVAAKHRKVHLFDIDVPGKITFKESETLSAGERVSNFRAGEAFGTVGVGICYDVRFPELALLMVREGARVLVYPGAFNMVTGPAHWELLMRARALDCQAYVIGASPSRTEAPKEKGKYPHYTAWGHSMVVSPWGEVVGQLDEQEGVLVVDLDMARLEEVRQSIPTSQQKRYDVYALGRAA